MNSFAQPLKSNAPLINRDRLWQSLMDLAQLGATVKGGVCRLALTDLDRQARDLFVQWCEAAGRDVVHGHHRQHGHRRQGRELGGAITEGAHVCQRAPALA